MPSVFKWSDALSFGLAAVVATALSIWAQAVAKAAPVGFVIMWITAAGFWFIYAMLLRMRWQFKRSIEYVTKHGVLVAHDNALREGPARAAVEAEIDRVCKLWSSVAPLDVIDASLKGALLVWKPFPFDAKQFRPGLFAGLAWPARKTLWVGYRDHLDETALGHELGHLFMFAWKGDDSDAALAEMEKNLH